MASLPARRGPGPGKASASFTLPSPFMSSAPVYLEYEKEG